MTIYRGVGGGGDATSDVELNALITLSTTATDAAIAAQAAQSAATTQAGNASASASAAAASASWAQALAGTAPSQAGNAGKFLTTNGTDISYSFVPTTSITGLATVATTGAYNDLTGKPTLGTAAATDSTAYLATASPSYTGTLTGGTGVVNLGSGQFYKDASGNVGIGTTSPAAKLQISSSSGGDTSGLRITRTDAGGGDWRIWPTATANGEGGGKLIFGTSSNYMTLDGSGNLGVGTTSIPSECKLAVSGTGLVLQDASGAIQRFNKTLGTDTGWLSNRSYGWHDGNGLALSTQTADALKFGTNSAERARIDSSGNLLLKATGAGTSASGVLGMGNATAPTSSPAGMGQLYVENGALKFRGSSGTVTTIAPA
jgi:hypothetical protein